MAENKSWKNINKFRLFTIVGFSLLTSLSLAVSEELWTVKEVLISCIQAGIAAFAYLQCPAFSTGDKEKGVEVKDEKL